MEILLRVLSSEPWKTVAKGASFPAVFVKGFGLTLRNLFAAAVPFMIASVSVAQEVPELDLSIPAGRLSKGVPDSVIIPTGNNEDQASNSGWVLVYRNLVTSTATPNSDVRSKPVKLPNSKTLGVITWEIIHTENRNCLREVYYGCPDQIEILSVPEGYMAVPERAEVAEREGLKIYIVPILIG